MREILFRGKCVDTGNWYEGYYMHLHKTTYCVQEDYERFPGNDIHQIVFERMTDWGLPNQHYRVDVDPKTVGQFTGEYDRNGKRIFEGDILKRTNGNKYVWYIDYKNCAFCANQSNCNYACELGELLDMIELEVIGNIHDNPELLEE